MYKKILLLAFIISLSFKSLFAGILSDWDYKTAYRPIPVIFVHGIISNSLTWQDSIGDQNNALSQYFFRYDDEPKGIPLPILRDNVDGFIYPSENYLEAFNYGRVPAWLSDSFVWEHIADNVFNPQREMTTLDYKIKKVLEGYYGVDYATNPDAKVILVSHSMGGLLARYYVQEKFRLGQSHYVKRIVMIGVPNTGSFFADIISTAVNTGDVKDILIRSIIQSNPFLGIAISIIPNAVISSITGFSLDAVKKGAIEDMKTNSQFLSSLNSVTKPSDVEYSIIIGQAEILGQKINSDTVVSIDSQKASGVTGLNIIQEQTVNKFHWEETKQWEAIRDSLDGANNYDNPKITITSPVDGSTTSQGTVTVEGTVEDYLPAMTNNISNSTRVTIEVFNNNVNIYKREDLPLLPNDDNKTGAIKLDNVLLQDGANQIVVTCTNAGGLQSSKTITVTKTVVVTDVWPMFRYDAQHTGRSPNKGPSTSNLKWSFITGRRIFSSPAIASDGTIYISCGDITYAINPDGSLKWSYPIGERVSPAIGKDGTIYIGSWDGLYALDPNGLLKWSINIDIINSSPVIDDNGVIYIAQRRSEGKLYAINQDGTIKWIYNPMLPDTAYSGTSPTIDKNGTVYYGITYAPFMGIPEQRVIAINNDGSFKWQYSLGYSRYIIGSSPSISEDGTIYIGAPTSVFYALNPNGTLKWSYNTGNRIISSSPGIGTDSTVYVGVSPIGADIEGELFAFNPDGTLKWKNTLGGIGTPAIDSNNVIYVGSFTKNRAIWAINPDGSIKWSYLSPDFIVSSPAIGLNQNLYIGSYGGIFYAFDDPITVTSTTNNITQNTKNNLVSVDGSKTIVCDSDTLTKAIFPAGALSEDAKITIVSISMNPGEGIGYEFKAESTKDGKIIDKFNKPVTIVIHYTTTADKITNTDIKVNEVKEKLSIFSHDKVQWVKIGGVVNADEQTITVKVSHFSKFAIMPTLNATEFIVNKVVPNPVTPNNDGINDKVYFYYENPTGEEVSITIYSVTGSKIKEIDTSTGTTPYWDGTNESGNLVEGGIYIYQIKSGNRRKNGTIILAK